MQPTKTLQSKDPAHTLRIRGQDISVSVQFLPQSQLRYFDDNPRVYSAVRIDGRAPTQDEIQSHLLQLDHVKQLIHDIKLNDGLIDPLIVRDGTYEVLEGNSRLAAYRALAKGNPIKWTNVKCMVLPADINEALVFALLGQYHIKGKKDWQPFEQAGFLYRRHLSQKTEQKVLAQEIGLSPNRVKLLIDTYQFMVDHKQTDTNRWSYFEEYLKAPKIRKAREKYPKLDTVVIEGIDSGDIERAVDVRDRLSAICKGSAKVLTKYAEGVISFDHAYDLAVASGAGDIHYKRLERFRHWVVKADVEEFIIKSKGQLRAKIEYEIDKLYKRLKVLHSKISCE